MEDRRQKQEKGDHTDAENDDERREHKKNERETRREQIKTASEGLESLFLIYCGY